MSGPQGQPSSSPWARLAAEVPSGSAPARALLVGPGADDAGALDAGELVHWNPLTGEPRPDGTFELVVCAAAIEADPHPANLLLAIWEVMADGATLLLHSRVLTDPAQSAYARFVAAHAGRGESEWLPGRLALRWTVETNGFDVERWIDAGSSAPRGEDDAFLVAARTARTPSLVLATPVPVDGPSQRAEDA
jgi:hypothetical protein